MQERNVSHSAEAHPSRARNRGSRARVAPIVLFSDLLQHSNEKGVSRA